MCLFYLGNLNEKKTDGYEIDTSLLQVSQEVKQEKEREVVESKKPKQRKVKMVAFTANWCSGCIVAEQLYDGLKEAGWDIGEEDDNVIVIVDIDKHPNGKFGFNPSTIPVIAEVVDGKVDLDTLENPNNLFDMSNDGQISYDKFADHFNLIHGEDRNKKEE